MSKTLSTALRTILQTTTTGTQTDLQTALYDAGFRVTQSTVSRQLRKLGAVKSVNAAGETVYRLPQAAHEIGHNLTIKSLVENIAGNEQVLLIRTRSGCGNVVAQLLDEQNFAEILGTLAGDNTILVIPKSIRHRPALEKKLRAFFA